MTPINDRDTFRFTNPIPTVNGSLPIGIPKISGGTHLDFGVDYRTHYSFVCALDFAFGSTQPTKT